MSNMIPIPVFIVFNTPKGKYIYDRNTNSIMNVSISEYEILSDAAHPSYDETLSIFQNKGYLIKGNLQK